MKKFNTIEAAFADQGLDPAVLPIVDKLPEEYRDAVVDFYKLLVATKAVNEGKKADWADSSERKWVPWADVKQEKKNKSGFDLVFDAAGCTRTFTDAGSRLSSRTSEAAEFLFKKFKGLYESIWLE